MDTTDITLAKNINNIAHIQQLSTTYEHQQRQKPKDHHFSAPAMPWAELRNVQTLPWGSPRRSFRI